MQLPNFTISNILSPIDIPTSALQQFFLDRDVVDLHDKSLVSITVTELVDSVLIACSMDHIIADGNSYRHFLNMGSEAKSGASLSLDYFENVAGIVILEITAGELLDHGLSWVAWKLHQAMVNHTDKVLREWIDVWLQSPWSLTRNDQLVGGHSTRGINEYSKFNTIDGNEFGMGKPLAFCSGNMGKISDGNMVV
ncbi:hypothetical protein FEM48_Zijuj10G0030100 [Ziziphus jujuba var. spinosa]|uniref:Uncharacterized protein n=1 Tax=Ziziphus jujuba var. spinosa TaxID=714518 RepID=A0A978UKX1_ZIZJJ|nr:hypothetical protein FEM48_Zijuj10G0030100 [Ziziphus jujuba var. spinosa]